MKLDFKKNRHVTNCSVDIDVEVRQRFIQVSTQECFSTSEAVLSRQLSEPVKETIHPCLHPFLILYQVSGFCFFFLNSVSSHI